MEPPLSPLVLLYQKLVELLPLDVLRNELDEVVELSVGRVEVRGVSGKMGGIRNASNSLVEGRVPVPRIDTYAALPSRPQTIKERYELRQMLNRLETRQVLYAALSRGGGSQELLKRKKFRSVIHFIIKISQTEFLFIIF